MRSNPSFLRLAHRWAGLAVGVLFLIQAASGILWSNQEALGAVFHPEALVASAQRHASLDAVFSAIARREPTARLDRIVFPSDSRLALTAWVTTGDGQTSILLVDPGEARILSSGPLAAYPEQLAERVHGSLLIGPAGHWVLFGEGLLLVGLAASGLVLWWPGRARLAAALTFHPKGPPRRTLRESHLIPGAGMAGLFLIIGCTGALMAAEPVTASLVACFAPLGPDVQPALPPIPARSPTITAQQAFDRLRARFPSARLVKVRTQGQGDRLVAALFVDPRSANPMAYDMAAIDRATGALTVLADAAHSQRGDAAIAWLTPVHNGAIYGPFRPLVATGGGLALIAMVLTGLANWLARRSIGGGSSKPAARSPTR